MPFDNLGRNIEGNHDDLAKSLLGPVGEAKPFVPKNQDEKQVFSDKILSSLSDLKSAFDSSIAQAKEYTDRVVKEMQSGKKEKGLTEKGMSSVLRQSEKETEKSLGPIFKLAEAGLKKGSVHTFDYHNNRVMLKMMNQQGLMLQFMGQFVKLLAKQQGVDEKKLQFEVSDFTGPEGSTKVVAGVEDALQDIKRERHEALITEDMRRRKQLFGEKDIQNQIDFAHAAFNYDPFAQISRATGKFSSFFMGDVMHKGLMGGASGIAMDLAHANEYQKIVHGIAYTTEGVTIQMKQQQKEFRAASDMANASVVSGQHKEEVEKNYVKLLQKGFKTQKETFKITKTSAHLATMIGSDFAQTADFVHEMHIGLGLSSDTIGEISRGMQSTAKSSKLSGDSLVAAAAATKPMLMNMRKAGTLTGDMANNMIKAQAFAQQSGMSESLQDVFQAMSSATALDASGMETRNLLYTMARSPEDRRMLFSGKALSSPETMKNMASELQSVVSGITGGRNIQDLTKMDPMQLSIYNRAFKGMFGKESGEIIELWKLLNKLGMSFSDQLTDVRKKLADSTITEQERTDLLRQQSQLISGERSNVLQSMVGTLGETQNISDIRNNSALMKKLEEARKGGLFGEMSSDFLQSDQGVREAIKKSLSVSFEESNKALKENANSADDQFIKKDFRKQIDIALASGDTKTLSRLTKESLEAQDAVAKAEKKATDPAEAAKDQLVSLNAAFSKYSNEALWALKTIAGSQLISGLGIVSLVTGALSPIYNLIGGRQGAAALGGTAVKGAESILKTGVLQEIVAGVKMGLGEGLTSFLTKIPGGTQLLNVGSFIAKGFADKIASGVAVAKSIGGGVSGLVGNAAEGVGSWIGSGKATQTLLNGVMMQKKIPIWGKFAGMFGVFEQAEGMMATLSPGIKGITSLLTKMALPVGIVTSGLFAMNQALTAGEHAGEIFEKVGNSERAAAEGAGFLTGILNTLTFGIFSKWIGATGEWTNSLAKFLNDAPLLNYGIQALMIIPKVIYGITLGLWDMIKEIGSGIYDALGYIFQPFNEAIKIVEDSVWEAWDAIKDVFSPFKELFGEMEGTVSIVSVLRTTLKGFGYVIAQVIRGIGLFIGTMTKVVVPIVKGIVGLIRGMLQPAFAFVKPFIEGFARTLGGLYDVFNGLMTIVSGIMSFDGKTIWSGIKTVLYGAMGAIGGLVEAAFTGVLGYIVGIPNLIFAGLMNSIGSFFKYLGKKGSFFQFIGEMFSGLANAFGWLLDIVRSLSYGELYKALQTFLAPFKWLYSWGAGFFTKVISIGSVIYEKIIRPFMSLADYVWQKLGNVKEAGGIALDIVNPLSPLKWIWNHIPHFATGGIVDRPTISLVGEAGPEAIVPLKESSMTPVPLSNIQTRLQQERVTKENGELATLSTLTEHQISIMKAQLSELQAIHDMLKPSEGQRTPSTRSQVKPPNSPDYFTFNYPGYGGMANKGSIGQLV